MAPTGLFVAKTTNGYFVENPANRAMTVIEEEDINKALPKINELLVAEFSPMTEKQKEELRAELLATGGLEEIHPEKEVVEVKE